MGWIRTCRLSFIAAVLGMMILFARGPLGAEEKKEGVEPTTGSAPAPALSQPPSLPKAADKKPEPVQGTNPVRLSVPLEAATMDVVVATGRPRFNFKIDPTTPLKDLLPIPPAARHSAGPVLEDDLTRVPEIAFQKPLAKNLPAGKALEATAHTMAKINHVNQKKTDAFMEALLGSRADLSGLPFAMGDSCRLKQERSRHFQQALNTVRQTMGGPQPVGVTTATFTPTGNFPNGTPAPLRVQVEPAPSASRHEGSAGRDKDGTPIQAEPTPGASRAAQPQSKTPQPTFIPPPPIHRHFALQPLTSSAFTVTDERGSRDSAEQFWQRYRAACLNEDVANAKFEPPYQEHVTLARIAALMQILAPESASMRKGLVTYLATVSHPEATRALAKLAIFSKERNVREAACDALKVRRERDYTEILLSGLHYPWPAVATHAADAIVRLERKDLIPQLVAVLEQPDPRLPEVKKTGDKSVTAVRELVRVNHHRNCLMCHAPTHNIVHRTLGVEQTNVGGKITTSTVSGIAIETAPDGVPTAQVPIPGEPLPTPSEGYGNSQPDILVRLDVTYLRQDFSEMQSVADAHPWPEMQRFDFLVRTRTLTDEEGQVYLEKLSTREPGRVTPYQRAALAALRELTGRDTEPTAQAWRRLLNLTQ